MKRAVFHEITQEALVKAFEVSSKIALSGLFQRFWLSRSILSSFVVGVPELCYFRGQGKFDGPECSKISFTVEPVRIELSGLFQGLWLPPDR